MSDLPEDGVRRKRKPHQADPWYKRYPRDFYDDTRDLSLAERGAYNDVIDLIYMAGGPLRDDEASVAYRLHVHVRTWRPIRRKLLARGFLFTTGGKLHNKRAKEVLKAREDERKAMGQRADKPLSNSRSEPDLFENVIDFNAPVRASSTDSYSDSEKKKEKKNTARRPIPTDIICKLVDQLGTERAEALIEEYHVCGCADGARRLRVAFPAWLAKEHAIILKGVAKSGDGVGEITEQMMGDLCGRDEQGKPITALPTRVRK